MVIAWLFYVQSKNLQGVLCSPPWVDDYQRCTRHCSPYVCGTVTEVCHSMLWMSYIYTVYFFFLFDGFVTLILESKLQRWHEWPVRGILKVCCKSNILASVILGWNNKGSSVVSLFLLFSVVIPLDKPTFIALSLTHFVRWHLQEKKTNKEILGDLETTVLLRCEIQHYLYWITHKSETFSFLFSSICPGFCMSDINKQ